MNVNKRRKDSVQTPLKVSSYLDGRIGLWATVLELHSESNTVDLLTDSGYKVVNIPVISKEWVCNDSDKDFISGQRNLPPKNSRVFVLMPYRTLDGAFVLCSGYTAGDNGIHNLYATSKDEIEIKNDIEEKISNSGWNSKEYYKDGNKVYVSLDQKIKLEIVLADNSEDSLVKGINLIAWDNKITLTPDGLSVQDKNKNSISSSKDGISLKDFSNNELTTSSSGIVIKDSNGNKIETKAVGSMGTPSISLNGHLEVM